MNIVVLGPQGAGKGTQSRRIAEKYEIPAIATGDIFRWAIKGGTDLGGKVLEYVEAGNLVPDDLTIQVVRERLEDGDCKEGFLLDGFPRSLRQAEALDEILAERGCTLDAAVAIEVPEDVSLSRLVGRRACTSCGRNYSIEEPPANDWICDTCGGEVEYRADDREEATVRARLNAYRRQSQPIKDYYRERGVLREIDGVGSPDEVHYRIVEAL